MASKTKTYTLSAEIALALNSGRRELLVPLVARIKEAPSDKTLDELGVDRTGYVNLVELLGDLIEDVQEQKALIRRLTLATEHAHSVLTGVKHEMDEPLQELNDALFDQVTCSNCEGNKTVMVQGIGGKKRKAPCKVCRETGKTAERRRV